MVRRRFPSLNSTLLPALFIPPCCRPAVVATSTALCRVPALALPDVHAQKRFAEATFEREFRLVGPLHRDDAVKKTVPAAMLPLVPPPPAPQSSLFPAGASTADGSPHAALFKALKEKFDDEEMEEHLAEALPDAADRAKVFMHAILVYGSANYRNVTTLFERYESLLSGLADSPACIAQMAAAVNDVWKAAPHVAGITYELMVDAGVCPPGRLLQWMFAVQAEDPLKCLRYTTWEWVTQVLDQAVGNANNSQANLDNALVGGETDEDALEVLQENAATQRRNIEGAVSEMLSVGAPAVADVVVIFVGGGVVALCIAEPPVCVQGFCVCLAAVDKLDDPMTRHQVSLNLWARLRALVVRFRHVVDAVQAKASAAAPAGSGEALCGLCMTRHQLAPPAPYLCVCGYMCQSATCCAQCWSTGHCALPSRSRWFGTCCTLAKCKKKEIKVPRSFSFHNRCHVQLRYVVQAFGAIPSAKHEQMCADGEQRVPVPRFERQAADRRPSPLHAGGVQEKQVVVGRRGVAACVPPVHHHEVPQHASGVAVAPLGRHVPGHAAPAPHHGLCVQLPHVVGVHGRACFTPRPAACNTTRRRRCEHAPYGHPTPPTPTHRHRDRMTE